MQIRVKKVVHVLKREKADALLVWNSEGGGQPATRWLSGFTGSASITLITKAKQYLITDGRYAAQGRREAKGFEVHITSGRESSLDVLAAIIKKSKGRTILFDGSVTPYSAVEDAQKVVSGAVFLSRKRVLQELRIVKEKGEIRLLTTAANIACRSFEKLLPRIRVGVTEKELAKHLEALCLEEGAEGLAFPTIIASGKNGALPHARATEKKIQRGELITIDFGVRYRGYVSDMTRTVGVGKIAPRFLKMYEAVRVAQEIGCSRAKAGITGQALDAICRDYIIKKGFGEYFTHSTGHGIGVEVHELPVVASHKAGKDVFRAGSVITCEPGIYIPNVGGVRIEDALVLTSRGSINLTRAISRNLKIL